MVNKKKLVLAAPVPLDLVDGSLNWSHCCFCQKSDGDLVCPGKNPNASLRNAGYKKVASNFEVLKSYQHVLPSGRTAREYDDGSGIEETLIKNKAKWHKKCVINYTTRFSTDGLLKVEAAKSLPQETPLPSARQTRSASVSVNPKEEICFLCNKESEKSKPLHRCMTYEIHDSVKAYAEKANDTKLLAFLADGDLVAQEAKYHSVCLLGLYRKGLSSGSALDRDKVMCEGLAFADLVLYMHSELEQLGRTCVFNAAALRKLYVDRLAQLLGREKEDKPTEVHAQRFREKILLHFPELQAIKSGREYVLMAQNSNILNNIDDSNEDLDALAVNRFIRHIRNNILETETSFTGEFPEKCEERAIPPALLALVSTILYGSTILADCRATRPALTISQLIMANMLTRKPQGAVVRLKKSQEPPLPLYLGLSAYGKSRDKKQIDEMHEMGLSVSSKRIYELTAQLARMVVNRANEEGVVCPAVLEKGIFTVGALDNIDHKPTSTTSQGEFHGTGISLFQLPLRGDISEQRTFQTNFQEASDSGSTHVPNLPDGYSEIPELNLRNPQPQPPICSPDVAQALVTMAGSTEDIWHGERDWLAHIHEQLSERDSEITQVSWSAFRAVREETSPLGRCSGSLLPLFEEKSTDPAMVKHGINLVISTTEFLNPGQTPVLCMDQPLFATGKLFQWENPDLYGEKKLVLLFGPLHIEQIFLGVIGQVMEGSGWAGIVGNSGILPTGSAEGLLKVKSIVKARTFHQYTAAVLYSLLEDAYCCEHPDRDVSMETWMEDCAAHSPMFKYWLLVLRLDLLLLEFLRSVREGNYELFKKSIVSMLPWMFSLDHHLYARWLTVHAVDLLELESSAPEVHRRFSLGSFVVRKTDNPFSCMGVDQAHEQNNADVKSKGGAIGLTQDPSSLRRWTVSGPEVTRLLADFKREEPSAAMHRHHEQYPSFQKKFVENCAALKESFLQNENPFLVRGEELFALDTRIEIGRTGIDALNKIETSGRSMLHAFVEERLASQKLSFHASVKKANLQIFVHKKSKSVSQVAQLKTDVQLFSRLFIVSLARSLDLDLFFAHENQPCPPALSTNGKLRSGTKHELVPILEKLVGDCGQPNTCDGLVFDGAALVRMIKPRPDTSSFDEFSNQLNSYVTNLAGKLKTGSVALVWDQYDDDSIKSSTRESRGTGTRRPDLPQKGAFPQQQKQWDEYLKNACNKQELFPFLAEHALNIQNLQVVTNVGDTIKGSQYQTQGTSLHNVSCAQMEEADGRLILHVRDMVQHGAKRVTVRCADTDILVLAVSFFHSLEVLGLEELWLLYGTASKKRVIPAHAIAQSLGEDKSCALRGHFAFTGCDTVSFFASKGKKSAWAAWKGDDFTVAFKALASPHQSSPTEDVMATLERFVVQLYGAKGQCSGINTARKELFATHGKPVGMIPPTAGALRQHTLRAAYQAGQVWGRADRATQDIPSPANWGWKMTATGWQPHWSDLDDIWTTFRDLSICGCASDCGTKRCSCVRADVPCALACKKCKGSCLNSKKERAVLPAESDNEDVDGDLQKI